ncbi:MAG: hypothetical protein ACPGSC_06440 [Granulosicoccaceae bacterium]
MRSTNKGPKQRALSTDQKALELNLNPLIYGTIAEIGAGQEVARNFFRAGAAAGTVAKTISAYDMQFSDAIYGAEASGRYVSRPRVESMVDREYQLVVERLTGHRPKNSTFFAYAATVAAKSYGRASECHAWLSVQAQLYPGAEPSRIVIHVRMNDDDATQQQEALGIVGVNLIHAAFNFYTKPKTLISKLSDNLAQDRIEIDLIDFQGPYFEDVDNRLINMELIHAWHTRAIIFTPDGKVAVPGELLYKKNVLAIRGSFRPVTNLNVDMIEQGCKKFIENCEIKPESQIILTEITMASLMGEQNDQFDPADFLTRVDMLNKLGYSVMISDFVRYFRLRAFFRRYTQLNIGIVVGMANLKTIFNESFYEGMEGGILEAFGKLFPDHTQMFVYPEISRQTGELRTMDNPNIPENLLSLYKYLLENNFLCALEHSSDELFNIYSRDLLQQLRRGRGVWEDSVPSEIAELIIEQRLLGYGCET